MDCGEHHVYARVSGYCATVTPCAPYSIRYGPHGDNVLEVEHGDKYVRVTFEDGAFTSEIAEGTESLADVVDVTAGPEGSSWSIETAAYRCCLPKDYWLCSTDDDAALFDLVGPHDELIFFQSPAHMPPVPELVGPGQSIEGMDLDGDKGWIELSYDHEGVAYRKCHLVLLRQPGNLALTVQAPAECFADARAVMEAMAGSLELEGHP